jgi:aldehyde dehydrogenase (NAD+)
MMDEKALLQQLGIKKLNAGAFSTKWLKSSVAPISSVNPATEKTLAHITPASKKNLDEIITNAKESFHQWREIPAPKRGELIRCIGDLFRKNKDLLGSLISLEMGKIKSEGDGEVQEVIDMADFAVGQSRMLYGNTMHSERAHHRMYEQWHPLGVVGIITAFNFPMAVWAWNAFLAVICGNTVIWKPSSQTPLCAIALQHICHEAMKICDVSGIFSLLISSDKKVSEELLINKNISLISFTGSSKVGHHVANIVSNRLGRYLLECSGNNAVIIDKSANLSIAVPSTVFGSIGTAGQRCTTTRRLFIHKDIYDEVILHLVKAYQQVNIGNPLNKKILMGPLINKAAVENYLQAITLAKKEGGKILQGGKIYSALHQGYFVEPTIISAKNHWHIVQRETFAPIVYVMKFNTIEEAIEMQNDVPQGLSSALFTECFIQAEKYLSSIGSDCGIANINTGTSGAEIGGAFGGEKETGGGREAGSDAWKNYMRRQTCTLNWSGKLDLAQGIHFDV